MNLIKKTTVREYDTVGKVTKETVTEEYVNGYVPSLPKVTPNSPWNPSQPYWQQPLISNGGNQAVPCDISVRIEGDANLASVGEAVEAAFLTG